MLMSKPIVEIRERLQKALELRQMTQQELSDITEIPKSSISQYLSGYAKPKDDRIHLISKALDVQEPWLLGYDVPIKHIDAINEEQNQYYLNEEAGELAKEMFERPELKVLFDASRNVTKEDILSVANILEKLKTYEDGDM